MSDAHQLKNFCQSTFLWNSSASFACYAVRFANVAEATAKRHRLTKFLYGTY